MIRIFQQRNKCIGCSACVMASSQRWRISRLDGKCTLVGGKEKNGMSIAWVQDEEYIENVIAMKNCPVHIIRVERV